MPKYYDNWKQSEFRCKHCSWSGLGNVLVQGEVTRDLSELCCPNCGELVDVVLHPTIEESQQNWDKTSELQRHAVQTIETRQKDFSRRHLSNAAELPDLPGDNLEILWDMEHYEGGDILLRHGDHVLWKEPSFYEGYRRFLEVGEILIQKYGSRLRDLKPTEASSLYLYGDSISASGIVQSFRDSLKLGKFRPQNSTTITRDP